MSDIVQFEGYGATAILTDGRVKITASSAFSRAALGAAERTIALADITALEFRDATALTNGSITVQSSVGKTVVHFRRKQAPGARALHAALREGASAPTGARVTARFANERRDAWELRAAERLARRRAELEELRVAQDAELQRLRSEFEAGRAERAEANRQIWADLRGSWSSTSSDAAELAAFLDTAEARDPLDVGDEAAAEDEAVADDVPQAAEALADPTVSELAAAALADAEVAARAGDISKEEQRIRWALMIARTQGGRADRKVVRAEIDRRIREGTLRRGAHHLGEITSEGGFGRWVRTDSLLGPSRGEKRIDVWSDRIITASSAYPITPHTGAEVYVDGQVVVTQRPTLTRMVLFAPLPGSTLIPGLAAQKKEKRDTRSAEIQIRDVNWALRAALNPDALSVPRQLAEQINANAAALADGPPAVGGTDLLSQLERLSFLADKGVISADEVQAIKAALMR